MNYLLTVILAVTVAVAPATWAACLAPCTAGAPGGVEHVTASHCIANMHQVAPCPPDDPAKAAHDTHDAACGCMTCRQGRTDAERVLHTLARRTPSPFDTLNAAAGMLGVASEALVEAGPSPADSRFAENILPLPDQPRISSVVLLI